MLNNNSQNNHFAKNAAGFMDMRAKQQEDQKKKLLKAKIERELTEKKNELSRTMFSIHDEEFKKSSNSRELVKLKTDLDQLSKQIQKLELELSQKKQQADNQKRIITEKENLAKAGEENAKHLTQQKTKLESEIRALEHQIR